MVGFDIGKLYKSICVIMSVYIHKTENKRKNAKKTSRVTCLSFIHIDIKPGKPGSLVGWTLAT